MTEVVIRDDAPVSRQVGDAVLMKAVRLPQPISRRGGVPGIVNADGKHIATRDVYEASRDESPEDWDLLTLEFKLLRVEVDAAVAFEQAQAKKNDPERKARRLARRQNKFHAVKAAGDSGRLYDSKAERDRANELLLLQQAGQISDLREQTVVDLVAEITYRPDFDYLENGRRLYEDVKGVETEAFRLKCKLWRHFGPGPLRVLKRKGSRAQFTVAKEVLPGVPKLKARKRA